MATTQTLAEGLVGMVAGEAVQAGRRIGWGAGGSGAGVGGSGRLGRPGRARRGHSGVWAGVGVASAALTGWCRLGRAGTVRTGWLGLGRFCCGLRCLCRAGGGVLAGAEE